MTKNYMPEVAKMLGVELEEEFKFKGLNRFGMITEEGLVCHQRGETNWDVSDSDLTDLLIGCLETEKLPWKPNRGDTYWYVCWKLNLHTKKWEIDVSISTYDDNCPPHNLCVDTGNCFKTREEAEEQKYEAFKRLTGKEWSEAHGEQSE